MKRVKQQLLDLMGILQERASLNPDGSAFQITAEQLNSCPDHDALLTKLEKEYDVIEVNQRPDESDYGDADHSMFEAEHPKNYALYMSYFITLTPTFEAFYKAEYKKHRFTLDTLTKNNLRDVVVVMHDIDDEMTITGSDEIDFVPSDHQSIDYMKVLKFLEKIGVVKNPSSTFRQGRYIISVKVTLPVFDETLAELESSERAVKEAPKSNASGAPIDYDDEHGKATYKGKTEKLFEANTISSFLTYKVTRADGARLGAADIASDYEVKHPELDKDITTKTLTNAKDRINSRFADIFSIEDVVCYERQQFWLNDKYCSPQSPYRKSAVKEVTKK